MTWQEDRKVKIKEFCYEGWIFSPLEPHKNKSKKSRLQKKKADFILNGMEFREKVIGKTGKL